MKQQWQVGFTFGFVVAVVDVFAWKFTPDTARLVAGELIAGRPLYPLSQSEIMEFARDLVMAARQAEVPETQTVTLPPVSSQPLEPIPRARRSPLEPRDPHPLNSWLKDPAGGRSFDDEEFDLGWIEGVSPVQLLEWDPPEPVEILGSPRRRRR